MANWIRSLVLVLMFIGQVFGSHGNTRTNECHDSDPSCSQWKRDGQCSVDAVAKSCQIACQTCDRSLDKMFDVSRLPPEMQQVRFLVGRWKSDSDGKVRFPSIPIFTYGEQVDFSIAEKTDFGYPSLNYSAFSWSPGDAIALHSEYGTLHVMSGSNKVALVTTMNNGFVTVEEGEVSGNSVTLKLVDIGRISWSRDLPVLEVIREYTLIDDETLDQRLNMKTLTSPLQEHTFVRYKKIA